MSVVTINSHSPFTFNVVSTDNTEIIIEARNIETDELYRGKTNDWHSFIQMYDLHRICAEACATFAGRGNHEDKCQMTATYECGGNYITVIFYAKLPTINNLSFSVQLTSAEVRQHSCTQ
jgi:hypothetical protein